ncbi:MAG: ABC transporter substrate-binding protein [Rothia sp. (in: high G+C Gram-positive bacteria)]|uniref:ABC transporter substrate-binding protein n=1 Tax=Rothia sp. (in: high G+C Gram-positive bacteria) TaxID=1885016 RepID=UPI0026FA8320|nr:ABC transporter substrate-binding protein [Rothia sp. (in: high G+C Gram-positive bacteria)]
MKIFHKTFVTSATLLLAFLLSACGAGTGIQHHESSSESTSVSTGIHQRTVTTDLGDVTIPTEPQRIVVLNYALTGYLFNLDLPVVGTTPLNAGSSQNSFSENWANEAQEAGTVLLPWANEGFDVEAILALEPDLIIAGGLGFPSMQAKQQYTELTKIAPTVVVSDQLTDWKSQLEFIATDVFDREDIYKELLATYDRRIQEVKNKISFPNEAAGYLLFSSDMSPFGIPEDSQLPLFFQELGVSPAPIQAENNFELYGSAGDSFAISAEQVSQTYTQPLLFVAGFNAETFELDDLRKNSIYASLPAFQEGTVEKLPYWFYRPDYDTTMDMLDYIEEHFAS